MSKDKTHIKIEVAIEDIGKLLQSKIRPEHSALIARTIMNHLAKTEEGVRHLYLAMSGIEVCPKFKVLDKVLVKLDSLAMWRTDMDKTQEKGFIFKGYMKGVVTEIDMTESLPYHISYSYIGSNGEEQKDTYWLNEKSIQLSNADEIL